MPISQELHNKLNEFLKLKDDWDSYGGVPITTKAVINTAVILDAAGDEVEVHIGPLPNGGIDIEWEIGDSELLLEVFPDGEKANWVLRHGEDYTNGTFDGDIKTLLKELLEAQE